MRNNLSFTTLKERIFLVKTFYQSSNNTSCVKSNFLLEFGPLEEAPTDSLIFEVINLFEETGSVREIPEFLLEDRKDTFIIDEIKLEEPEIKQEEEDDADSLLLPLPEISDIWGNIEGDPQETAKNPEETPKPAPKKRIRIRQRKSTKPRNVDPDRVQYECDICQKRLVSKRGMRRHMLRHTENEEALCKYCNTMIPTGKELKVHIKEKHAKEVEDEKPTTTCHVCSKTFKYATKLKRHLISHTEKKAVVCDVCGKGFKTKCALMVHMRQHTGEKPYKCEYPNCGREFHHSTSYIIHKRCHTGEKPYACEVCGKGFADKGTLRVHYRQHTGENPYVCELCGKTTKQKQNLKSHMMHFHNIDKVFNKEYKE